jgi:hypothetical protein
MLPNDERLVEAALREADHTGCGHVDAESLALALSGQLLLGLAAPIGHRPDGGGASSFSRAADVSVSLCFGVVKAEHAPRRPAGMDWAGRRTMG